MPIMKVTDFRFFKEKYFIGSSLQTPTNYLVVTSQ